MKNESSNETLQTAESDARISVQDAKETFAELERQLTQLSLKRDSISDDDPGKGDRDDGEFNLQDYLLSQNAAQDEAGITNHHKRVGVSWEALEVIVTSSTDNKVCPGGYASVHLLIKLPQKYAETFGSM